MCEKIIFHGGTHGFFGEIYWITVRKISCAHEDRRMGSNWKFFERWIINWPCLKKNSIGTGEVLITTTTWWRHHVETFSALLAMGIHRSPVNSPHKGQWREALMFSVICAWINGWVNNREAGDLTRHRVHYDVTVMNQPHVPRMMAIVLVLFCDLKLWFGSDQFHPHVSLLDPSQILQCTEQMSHNAPFCNRNVHTCAHFCYKMAHCGLRYWCIVGCVQLTLP